MDKPIVVALDFPTRGELQACVETLDPNQCQLKIGKEMFTKEGPNLVRDLIEQGFAVFLDLKFHDIPNTVAGAVKAAADLGVWMVNVHASGGRAMLEAAREAADSVTEPPLLIGVTVLTSLSAEDLQETGVPVKPQQQVLRLAQLCQQSGLDGVVCSAAETPALREQFADDFLLVTPGIRRPEDATGDQKRVVGPAEAMRSGSSFLVVGRPITRAESPAAALAEFNSALASDR